MLEIIIAAFITVTCAHNIVIMFSLMLADGDLTATKFTVEAHVKLFQQTFKHIHIDEVSSFAIAQVADSPAICHEPQDCPVVEDQPCCLL